MPRPRRLARVSVALSCLLLGVCDEATAPSTSPAGETWVAIALLGGRLPHRTSTLVDSAAREWRKLRCEATLSATPCRRGTLVARGRAPREDVEALFAALRAPAFRRLPASVAGGHGPEVDGVRHDLVVHRAGRVQSVQWNGGAALPAVLDLALVRLGAATGGSWTVR